ncbi:MAG TPA: hypothetical protein VGB84_08080, partial [Arachidicoccus sp.]
MKQILTSKLRIFLISAGILLAGYAVVKACADGDWGDGYDSNIAPEAFVDSAYTPFFSSGMFYYGIGHDDSQDDRFNEINTADWQSFIGKEMGKTTINFLLTKAGYNVIKSTEGFYMGKNALPDSMKSFSSNLHVNSSKEKVFIQYLVLAKKCEEFATSDANSWDYDTDKPKKQTPSPQGIDAKTFETLMQKETQPFLKERYWFQWVRYQFFYDLPGCITAFENNKKDFKPSVMYYRTMAYAAGAYYKQKNYSKANYYYSLVFAGNDALKTVAHYSFHPQDEKDWQQTLAMCANSKERITLWEMLGVFYSDEMRSMEEIYKLNPSDPALDLLLSRKINELESNGDTLKSVNKTYPWIQKVTDENKISNP